MRDKTCRATIVARLLWFHLRRKIGSIVVILLIHMYMLMQK